MTTEQKAEAARNLMAAGEMAGRFMSFADARKLAKEARYLSGGARRLCGQDMYARMACIAGTIMDDLRPRGATMEEIEVIAEGFAGMQLSCIPQNDLLVFNAGVCKQHLAKVAA